MTSKRRLALYSGGAHDELARAVADDLGEELDDANLRRFANGELYCRFDESVRGADVFIMQTHAGAGVNDAIMQQLIMIDSAKRASARHITAVCPRYGYARQDRKAQGREPISAKLMADMFTAAGADRMISIDLHTGQIQGFFNQPVDHLTAMPLLLDHIRATCDLEDVVIVSPDAGGTKAGKKFADHLDVDLAFVNKVRPRGTINEVKATSVIGHVTGKRCILVDDEIDTAGTISAAADLLVQAGATSVWAMATHGVLSDPAMDRIHASKIERLVITDTVPIPPEKRTSEVEVLSVAGTIAEAIRAVFEETSVSDLFDGENQR